MQENTAKMQSYPEDSVILREGERKDEMYKIVSGKAAVYINYGKENEYLLGICTEQYQKCACDHPQSVMVHG